MINPFNFFNKKVEKDPMLPKYIKPDGTKVIEEFTPLGKTIYEIKPNGTVISMTYNKSNTLIIDWARRVNLEIGHAYDELGQKVYEFNSFYNEDKSLKWKKEFLYEYHDNGKKSKETLMITPGDIKTETFYDEEGKQTEKIEYRGSVKTWFDENNKPLRREIDRGSGGIIKEDL